VNKRKLFVHVLTVLVLLVTCSSLAHAQATRTWVSGVGDDANPCSRTAPCKTWAGAISKTAAGGEIDCLDPGGYGAVTITKSITLDCTGTFGSILNSGTNGINVNDSATATPNTIDVIIRGISIDGAGTSPGLNGIRFISGRSLLVEDVFIQNQNGGNDISVTNPANARIFLNHVTMTDGAVGLLVDPTGSVGVTNVILEEMTRRGERMVIAQRYLPAVMETGDKRILLVDGVAVPGALTRIPAAGDFRANLAAGGRGEPAELTERERWICAEIGPALRARGLHFVGIDVIDGWLTEINVTSPTGIRQIDRHFGLNVAGTMFDALEPMMRR